jgi:hypothetical protein
VLLILGTNKQPSKPKHTNTHRGNLHDLLSVPHRSDRWLAPVRPVKPVRPVDRAGQAGGCSSCTTNVPESLSDLSRPWNQNTSKTQPARKKNPSQNQTKQLQKAKNLPGPTQPKDTWIQQLTRGKSHKGLTPVRPVRSTGQTGVTWAARDEQNPRVNSFKSNSRSHDSLTDPNNTLGIVGTPHGHSIAKLWSTKTR